MVLFVVLYASMFWGSWEFTSHYNYCDKIDFNDEYCEVQKFLHDADE